ncbi:MAG: GWxTD domain-containing protein [Ignavibacteriaceae bacterium]|nr:GWxTD domain-containing protein [Ignavibacteriaceae bacterium]
MKRLFYIVIFIVFAQTFVLSQKSDSPAVSSGEITFYLDNSAFLGKDNLTYQSFSIMIYADQLKLKNKNSTQTAVLSIEAKLTDVSGEKSKEKEWFTEASFEQDADLRTLVIYDKWVELLEPGEYDLSILIEDSGSRKEGQLNCKISVPAFHSEKFALSEISFINKIETGTENKIIANPSRRYGLLNPNLSFYYEIYSPQSNVSTNYVAKYSIEDEKGNLVKNLSDIEIAGNSPIKTVMQAIDISKLHSGVFNFRIDLTDKQNSQTISTSRKFEVIQPDYFAQTPFVTSEDSKQMEQILEFIATPDELGIYKKLNSGGKAYFVLRFFRDRDPDPTTPENEYLNELVSRYHFCNQKFSWAGKDGWQSERGRVFIQNGKPDEIDYNNVSADSKPYEIWRYRKDREYFYIFGDLLGNGNYVLLSSNKDGEVLNNNWRLQLQR